MDDVTKLEAELAELTAANEAATSWGAAVGAREERIKNIHSELRRLRASPRLPLREYTTFRYSAPSGSCKCGKCQLVPHAVVAHYADLIDGLKRWQEAALESRDLQNATIDRITAERDGLLSEVECLNSNARVQAKLLADTGRERDGLRKALEPFARHYRINDCQERHPDGALEVPISDLHRAFATLAALTPSVPDADR